MAPSSSRYGARVIWIVIHTAEGVRDADDLKAYFDRSTNSSSHAVADDTELIENCVPYSEAAWTLRSGNRYSDNLELCGFASWSRSEWLNNHMGMINNAAIWIRRRCIARNIPIVKLSADDVDFTDAGVIGHVDYTNGTGDGTHWDPGPGFPWDVVMNMARGDEDDVSAIDVWGYKNTEVTNADAYKHLTETSRMVRELWDLWRKGHQAPGDSHSAGEGTMMIVEVLKRSRAQEATINTLAGLLAQGSNSLTEGQVKAAVAEALAESTVNVDIDVTGPTG